MDETTLRALLDSALAGEPPIGPVADNALRAGIKARRRRVLRAALGVAAAAAVAIVVPVVTGPLGAPPARQHSATTWLRDVRVNVPPPEKSILRWRALARDRASIVKITGEAKTTTCARSLEGSGFVFAPQHVLTNAHVVAGVRGGVTVTGLRHTFHGTVVLYDPKRDVAILYVPGLRARPLAFASPPSRGDSAIVAGYPLNQGFTAAPARIGGEHSAESPDIYRAHTVTRDIYAVRAVVRPGNSGGPLLAPSGAVDGMVFAAAIDLADTGYALTAGEVASDVSAGRAATAPVSTHGCD